MGLGKTLQAIGIAINYRAEWPCLIVVPSSVRLQWADQFQKWAPEIKSDDINIVMNGYSQNFITFLIFTRKGSCNKLVNIISYDLLVRQKEVNDFKVVILDESHLIKSYNAKRTACIKPICERANRVILLSGTPALSRPAELYSQISAVDPKLLPNWTQFGMRYCAGYYAKYRMNYDGASNLAELHLLLENTIMIRRLKADVLSELPDKHRFQVCISVNKKYTQKLAAVAKELKNAKSELYKANTREQAKDPRNEKHRLVLELYKSLGQSKLPAIGQYIKDILETEDPTTKYLIFGHHKSVLDGICETLKSKNVEYIRIDGRTPTHQRFDFMNIFQDDPTCRFAVLSLTAAGVGLNLTAASVVLFAELYWNPGSLKQAEDRAHRLGQKRIVEIRYLTAKGTMDDYLWDMIANKLSVIGETLNGQTNDTLEASKLQFDGNDQPADSFIDSILAELESFEERNNTFKERKQRRKTRQALGMSADKDEEESEDEDVTVISPMKKSKVTNNSSFEESEEEEPFKMPTKTDIIEVDDEYEESQAFTKEQAEEKEKLALSKLNKFSYSKPINF
jgi:SWI/SNF-related matrix-associated actin-dependent regulator 1 of chromatin subfamily A